MFGKIDLEITFTVVCHVTEAPKAVTDAMRAVLVLNAIYHYWFPSYTLFSRQPVTGNKTATTGVSMSTSSLEMLIGSWLLAR
jgi:hypothetical protein